MARYSAFEDQLLHRLNKLIHESHSAITRGELYPNSSAAAALSAAAEKLSGLSYKEPLSQPDSSDEHGSNISTGLSDALSVSKLIINEKCSLNDACKRIAQKRGVEPNTIRDACCRRCGLRTSDWEQISWGGKEARQRIVDALIQQYAQERPDLQLRINRAVQLETPAN